MKKLLLLFILPLTSHAFFCPTNFKQIQIGDTIEEVTNTCGKPAKETTKEVEKEGAQEWSFFIPERNDNSLIRESTGTLKTSVAFDKDGKVINIMVNGTGIGSTTLCGGEISLGSTREEVKKLCGKPSYVNKQQAEDGAEQKKDKIIEYFYNTNPPMKMKFVNGILKERE